MINYEANRKWRRDTNERQRAAALLKRGAPLKPVSERMAKRLAASRKKRQPSYGPCDGCGKMCNRQEHHVMGREKRRDIDLLVDGPKLMLCPDVCHPLCKANPERATELGLIQSRHIRRDEE